MVTIPPAPFKNGVVNVPWKTPKPKLPPNLEQPANSSPWNYVPYNHTPGPGQQRDRLPLQDHAAPSIYQSSPSYTNTIPPKNDPVISIPRGEGPQTVGIPYGEDPTISIPRGEKPNVYSIQNQATPPPQTLTTSPTGQFSVTSNPVSGLSADSNPFQASTFSAQATKPSGGTKSPTTKKPVSTKKPTTSKPKKKSSLDKYLGKDADYQSTLRDLARALTDFKARQNVEKTRAGTEYNYAKRTGALQKDQDLKDIADDFAARGIVRSGVYGTRLGDYNTQYNEKTAELGRQYNNQLGDFSTALQDFVRNQALQKEAARQAAIRRRAAKLGKIS